MIEKIKSKDRCYEAKKKWRENNLEFNREVQKNYYIRNRDKLIKKSKEYQKNNLDKLNNRVKKYNLNNTSKIKAQKLARKITTKERCEICKDNKILQKHHWRYDKPLLVNTLCNNCHKIQHLNSKWAGVYGR